MKYIPRFVLVAGAIFVCFAGQLLACGCDLPPRGQSESSAVGAALGQSDAVFVGTVVEIQTESRWRKTISFEIESIWKGKLQSRIMITTGSGNADCGFPFELGEIYLVYASKGSETVPSTNICTRTRRFREARTDIRRLNKLKAKVGVKEASSTSSNLIHHFSTR